MADINACEDIYKEYWKKYDIFSNEIAELQEIDNNFFTNFSDAHKSPLYLFKHKRYRKLW